MGAAAECLKDSRAGVDAEASGRPHRAVATDANRGGPGARGAVCPRRQKGLVAEHVVATVAAGGCATTAEGLPAKLALDECDDPDQAHDDGLCGDHHGAERT